MATNGKKVYLVKLGKKSFRDGRRTFARIKHLNWDQLLATKAEIIQNLAVFSFCVRNRRFCNLLFLFLFTCEGNIQCAKKVLRLAMEHRAVINKIVFTSPEAMVEFSGGKKLKLLTAVNLYSFERSRNYPITNHATTGLCKECNQIRLYAERKPESRFRVMKVGRDVTVDDGGNYMSRFMS